MFFNQIPGLGNHFSPAAVDVGFGRICCGVGDGVDQGPGRPVVIKILCVNLCVKNVPKLAKIGKNRKKLKKSILTISVGYNILRGLGNPEALPSNP